MREDKAEVGREGGKEGGREEEEEGATRPRGPITEKPRGIKSTRKKKGRERGREGGGGKH